MYIRVLGGEPFLNKDLDKIINKLLKSNKIQRIEVVTNGTIIPNNKELLNILSNSRVNISISKYPYSKYSAFPDWGPISLSIFFKILRTSFNTFSSVVS